MIFFVLLFVLINHFGVRCFARLVIHDRHCSALVIGKVGIIRAVVPGDVVFAVVQGLIEAHVVAVLVVVEVNVKCFHDLLCFVDTQM